MASNIKCHLTTERIALIPSLSYYGLAQNINWKRLKPLFQLALFILSATLKYIYCFSFILKVR
jgi:hypothetical protein